MNATQSTKSFTLTKAGEKPMVFTQINETEVQVAYDQKGAWINDVYHAPVAAVHSVEFARILWKQYKAMGWA